MSRRSRRVGGRGIGGPRAIVSAAILVIAGVFVGWLSFTSAIVRTLPATAPNVVQFVPDHPDVVLDRAATRLVTQRGILDAATLQAVRRAAIAAPLDARPYLILGHQQLLDGMPERALATLEAGQRLDPRQRLIHLLLLDRYLRTARYGDVATQFSVLAKLLGATQAPIATAMAQMTMAPETRDVVRRTLRTDPALERSVMMALVKSDTPPEAIFALASPAAQADARQTTSWGPMLVNRMVEQGRYAQARSVWQRIYGLSPAQAATPITNAGFRPAEPLPPFDWVLTASELGAADMRAGSLSVVYYGRDSGDLAKQLLVLPPGTYRFAFTVDPGKADTSSKLFWSLNCGTATTSDDEARLMNLAVAGTARQRRVTTEITIPSGCAAQTLALRGEAGDLPAPLNVHVRDIALSPAPRSGPAS